MVAEGSQGDGRGKKVGFTMIGFSVCRFNKVLETTAMGSPSNYEEEMKSYYWPNK